AYRTDIRVHNQGEPIGRSLAIAFVDLPSGVTVHDPSGFDSLGRPYLNLSGAIPNGGLGSRQESLPVELYLANPNNVPLTVTTQLLDVTTTRPPQFPTVGPLTVLPGDKLVVSLPTHDADGDRVTYSLRTEARLPNGVLDTSGRLTFSPSPQDLGN